jgi:hypothetical protein
MDEPEIPLLGGRVTKGVVRIGDTVRRPFRRDHSLQHDLLIYLEQRGFDGSPRFLGIDALGRESLSFLPGTVPTDLGHFDDQQLVEAASLLRRFHDATAEFPAVLQAGAEVICHNDWGPPNCVFQGELPVGLIDFDTAAPGPRLWDIGYSAFSWLDIGDPDYTADEQLRRLGLFIEGYGDQSLTLPRITVYMVARQAQLSTSAPAQGNLALADWSATVREWTIAHLLVRLLPGLTPLESTP